VDHTCLQFYIDYAFEHHGPSYRTFSVEEAARQFVDRDLSYWIEQYNKEFPDGPPEGEEDEG
jgi:hypothetical protein